MAVPPSLFASHASLYHALAHGLPFLFAMALTSPRKGTPLMHSKPLDEWARGLSPAEVRAAQAEATRRSAKKIPKAKRVARAKKAAAARHRKKAKKDSA